MTTVPSLGQRADLAQNATGRVEHTPRPGLSGAREGSVISGGKELTIGMGLCLLTWGKFT